MVTILATWELGRGYGHLSALAPTARALRAAGIETVLAAREPATVNRLSDNPFASVWQAPLFRRTAPAAPTLTYATVIGDGGLNDPAAAEALVRAWLDLFAKVKPAAVLAEHAPASLLAAHVAGLPAARLGMGFTVPPAERPFPSLLPWTRASEAERAAADAQADAVVRHVCKVFGAPVLDGLAALLAAKPAFLATWPELDIYGARAGCIYYGPLGGIGGAARPSFPNGSGPRAVIYLSKGHPLAGVLADALTGLAWPTLWHGASAPAAPPPNIAVSPEPLDMPHVLAGATLQIGHTSHASLCEGLRAGKPQMMLPDTLETLLLAARLARQNFGCFLHGTTDAATLAAALETVAGDTSIAAAAAAARARYARYRPDSAAAELARDLVASLGLA